ncbi:MAG TPA: hypothetical protein PLA53_00110 [bacterium]|jgi:hypothetical protein|nr:hypothetical protein [bacterium]HNZ51689.1 hypothetical protein [bacterium]HOF79892.1 hypothetical protein [bacterium]HOH85411.1 hypothetical protein [bacterium]HOQ91815.1 hypothetical protein [bacterium]
MSTKQYLYSCLDKFYELPDEVILEFNHPDRLKIIDELAAEYGLELSFLVILIAINELSLDNLTEYLMKRYDLPERIAATITNKLNSLYFEPIIKRLSFFNQDPHKISPTLDEEKSIIINLFKENLLVELKNYEQIIAAINQRIFAWLDRDLSARKQIETALLQNQEKVTDQSLVINNEKFPGTVTNWLRCFAAEKGAENFNSLSISEFLGLSKNTTNLSDSDKKILRALFNTYRNIKFFPDSMPNDDGTDWAIIPLPEKNVSFDETIDLTSDSTTSHTTAQSIDPEMQPLVAPTKSAAAPKDEIVINKINQLQLMLKRYNPDSLEAQAITEEIIKLKKN